MNEQNQNIVPVVQANKKPVLLRIVALIALLVSFLVFGWSVLALSSHNGQTFIGGALFIPIGLGSFGMILAFNLDNMKKWALYTSLVFTLLILAIDIYLISIPRFVNYITIPILISSFFYLCCLCYLWSIRKQFN